MAASAVQECAYEITKQRRVYGNYTHQLRQLNRLGHIEYLGTLGATKYYGITQAGRIALEQVESLFRPFEVRRDLVLTDEEAAALTMEES